MRAASISLTSALRSPLVRALVSTTSGVGTNRALIRRSSARLAPGSLWAAAIPVRMPVSAKAARRMSSGRIPILKNGKMEMLKLSSRRSVLRSLRQPRHQLAERLADGLAIGGDHRLQAIFRDRRDALGLGAGHEAPVGATPQGRHQLHMHPDIAAAAAFGLAAADSSVYT